MKKLRSLVAAFSLAVAGAAGFAIPEAAQAQTVPAYAQQQTGFAISQDDVNDIAYNVGVQYAYPAAGTGYTAATAGSGQTIGLEYRLNGNGTATVARVFNLNDPAANQAFRAAENNSAAIQADANASAAPLYYYNQPRYEIVNPIVPLIGLGLLFDHYHRGYDYRRYDHHDDRRFEDHRRFEPPRREERVIIERRDERPRVEPRRDDYPRFEPRPQPRSNNNNGGWRHR